MNFSQIHNLCHNSSKFFIKYLPTKPIFTPIFTLSCTSSSPHILSSSITWSLWVVNMACTWSKKRMKQVESSMINRHNSPLPLLVFQRSLKKTLTTWKYAVCVYRRDEAERKKRLKVENHILMPVWLWLLASRTQ